MQSGWGLQFSATLPQYLVCLSVVLVEEVAPSSIFFIAAIPPPFASNAHVVLYPSLLTALPAHLPVG